MSDDKNRKNKKMKTVAKRLKVDVLPEVKMDKDKKNIDFSMHVKRFQKDFAILGKDMKRSYSYWRDYLAKTGQEKMTVFQSKYLSNLRIMKR